MTRSRGRPKRCDIAVLIVQGMNFPSVHQCKICKRSFPRSKNLNTHVLTHSDEKKYRCNFPDCTKCFKQSSQLKNHLLLHSKEKPFICPAEGCLARYTHSGRICPSHSSLKLIKQPETVEEIQYRFYRNVENLSEADKKWFEEYLSKRERKSPLASVKKRKIDVENSEDSIMKESESDDSIMKESESDDSIMKESESDDSIMKESESDDSIMKESDSDASIVKMSDSGDSIVKVSDSDDSIVKVSDSDDSIVKVSDSEYIRRRNIEEEIRDFAKFISFYKYVHEREDREDSKTLFKKRCYAFIPSDKF